VSIRRIRTALIIVNPVVARLQPEYVDCRVSETAVHYKLHFEVAGAGIEVAADDVADVLVHRQFTVSYSDGDADVTNFVQ